MGKQKKVISVFIFCYVFLFLVWQPLKAEDAEDAEDIVLKSKMGALLTLPDVLQDDEILPVINRIKTNKPFLTVPFTYVDNKDKQGKIWHHDLPQKKPVKKTRKSSRDIYKNIQKILAVSMPMSFAAPELKTIPYPTKQPKSSGYKPRGSVSIPIKVKKAPVTVVTAKDLPMPNIPSSSSEITSNVKTDGANTYILFEGNDAKVTVQMEKKLQGVKEYLEKNNAVRVQLHAFATGENGNPSSARRISLSRALLIREYFKQNGIRVTRMDIRALGDQTTKHPIDRLDFVFVE